MEEFVIGSKDLETYLDKKVIILMWDGKYLTGTFRSYDQFNSVTLENTKERLFCDGLYGELDQGVCVIRGENVVLIGILGQLQKNKKVEYAQIVDMLEQKKIMGNAII
ncbi:hypothetical protein COBT_001769 [Conglomerata obtusa]